MYDRVARGWSERLGVDRRLRPPIFIVGCGHSGTTVLRVMLGMHPQIHGVEHESGLFWVDSQVTGSRRRRAMLRKRVHSRILTWNEDTRHRGRHRWVEKTPRHVRRIHEIFARVDDCRVIHVLRDGRDVVCSLMERGYTFEEALDRWAHDVRAGLRYAWDSRVLTVYYEDLVRQPESELRRVCHFLGEKYSPKMLSFHVAPQHVSRSGSPDDAHQLRRKKQVQTPLYDGSGRWDGALTDEQVEAFEARASGMRFAA